MEYKEYGHWSADGKEYVITERKTPRHWYNYFFNDDYNAFPSQVGFGEGFCQDSLAAIDRILVNGSPLEGNLLPCDSKSTYRVEVLLR